MPSTFLLIVPFYNSNIFLKSVKDSVNLTKVDTIEVLFLKETDTGLITLKDLFGTDLIRTIKWSEGVLNTKENVFDFEKQYALLRKFLTSNKYEDFERAYNNAALFDILNALKFADSDILYRDILARIKYYIEEQFNFLESPVTHYYRTEWLKDYLNLIPEKIDNNIIIEHPKVTVVIPSLNSKTYIRECIESAIGQSLKELEILCVDAGSTDGTIEVLQEYADLDHRIKIIHSEMKSYGYQINLGIKNAHGEYLAILESDDYIVPEMYEELYQIAKNNNVELLRADYEIFTGEKGKYEFKYIKIAKKDDDYNKILNPSEDIELFRNNLIPWSGLYEVQFLRKNNIYLNESAGAAYQDNGLWFQCFCQATRLFYQNKSYYRLRRDNPNSSIYSKTKVYCGCEEYDFIRNFLRKDAELEKKFAPLCAYYRYGHYNWTLNRIAEEFKLEFYKRFAEDFDKIEANGELLQDYFFKAQWEKLTAIMNDPVEYYYGKSELTYEFKRCLPPKRYPEILCRWYKKVTGAVLNLNKPRTFSEKIQWLKLYDNTPLKAHLTDKYLVRDWVKEKIGEQYLLPLLGVWKTFEEIEFNKLPQKFVLKATHGENWDVIVNNKSELDIPNTKERFELWLRTNYAIKHGFELQYASIDPKIIAEQYVDSKDIYVLKAFCFNGKVERIMCLTEDEKGLKTVSYDTDWNELPVVYKYLKIERTIEKPKKLKEFVSLAQKLSCEFIFACVDFYIFNDGNIKFCGLSFTPDSGVGHWNPSKEDLELGKLLNLSLVNMTDLPEKSFAEKGVVALPVGFVLPKSETEELKDTIAAKNRRIASLEKSNRNLKIEIRKIRNSKAFRVGEKLAWPIRKIKRIIKK